MEEKQNYTFFQRRRSSFFGLSSIAISDDFDSKSSGTSLAVASLPDMFDYGVINSIKHWQVLICGQVLALILAGIGAASSELHLTCGLSAPTMLLGLMYFLLSFHFVPLVWKHYKRKRTKRISKSTEVKVRTGRTGRSGLELDELPGEAAYNNINPSKKNHTLPFTSIPLDCAWHKYFLVTLVDVESSFCIVLAYKYTTFTSVTLLTSLAVIGAMSTSKIIMNTRYQLSHFIGVLLCIVGIGVNILSDLEDTDTDKEYPYKMLGDAFAAFGGLFFGVNDAMAERIVKNSSQQQYIGLSGFFGVFICLPQAILLERNNILDFFDDVSTCNVTISLALAFVFAFGSYLKFVGDSYFLRFSEAALLNLSLLTVDFYSALFQIFAEQIFPSYKFFLALLLVVTGVFVYEMGPSPAVFKPSLEETVKSGDFNIELKVVQTNFNPYLAQREIT